MNSTAEPQLLCPHRYEHEEALGTGEVPHREPYFYFTQSELSPISQGHERHQPNAATGDGAGARRDR